MLRLLVRWVLSALALILIAYIVPNVHTTFGAALVAAIVIGVIDTALRPILVLLTLPITLLTLGLFLFVLNAVLFWLASTLVPGFQVNGFGASLLGSLIYSFLAIIITQATLSPSERAAASIV